MATSPVVTTPPVQKTVDWRTVCAVHNGPPQKVPSYEFSNGKTFEQPADRER